MSGLIRFADLAITPWRNGAGRKADIAVGEGWLVGIAFLDRNAPFSDYAGHDRTITLLDGAGFELDIAGHGVLRVERPHVPHHFDGGAPTACRLLAGPCRVLNAMTARADHTHQVRVLTGAELPQGEPDGDSVSLLILLRGHATIADGTRSLTIAPLDAVRRDASLIVTPEPAAMFAEVGIRS